jgi:hypothetical protein
MGNNQSLTTLVNESNDNNTFDLNDNSHYNVAENFMKTGIVFSQSSTQYLTSDDISQLYVVDGISAIDMIRYAINELYARNHYHFYTDQWSAYYSGFEWYIDYGYGDEETVRKFNVYEKANLDLLVNERNKLSS